MNGTPIDPALLDLLAALHGRLETNAPFQVISGYRSPKTNQMLAAKSEGVAKQSQHVQGKARAPREVNPALPAGLPEVIMQAMAVDKEKRYQTMPELRAALEKFR